MFKKETPSDPNKHICRADLMGLACGSQSATSGPLLPHSHHNGLLPSRIISELKQIPVPAVWSSQGLWSLWKTYKKAIHFWRNMKEVTYRRVSWNYLSGLRGHTSKTCLWLPSYSTAKDYCLEIPVSAKVILKPLTLQHALSWLMCFNPQNAKQNLRCA